MANKYPEHEKLKTIKNESQIIGSFLDYMKNEEGIILCRLGGHEYEPLYTSIEEILASYFDIDLRKINEEKEQMLEECRSINERKKENI